ncbi:hypothetical protein [Bifidobacterium choerinum]|uniref:Uncharacterized protein n=1 Tax=Bifidobacterium choerinum TaxID=35760 RepID=A0A087AFS4_9BIFI|nr:hypothetical protein [Bifidobacterium choerinum]KFI57624.1 hypothetical protein BCHO_1110 [Bifidobacterium choerinum]
MSIRKKRTCATCGAEIPRSAKEDRCDACIAAAADKKMAIAKIGAALMGGAGVVVGIALKLFGGGKGK